jgi:phosphocarrier protein HPr
MKGDPLRQTVVVTNPQGFHLRPIKAFVETANSFPCNVIVSRSGVDPANGKSPLSLMLLAAETGTELVIEANGPRAAEALQALVAVFQLTFDE